MKTELSGIDNHIKIIFDEYKRKGLISLVEDESRERSSSFSSRSSSYSRNKNLNIPEVEWQGSS